MLIEVGYYIWCEDLEYLVCRDREPSLKEIQERYWYREWIGEHITEEERALTIASIDWHL
jgi:hypothetical protein